MTLRPFFGLALTAALAAAALPSCDALACGACFHPPPLPATQPTTVTGHRMAFSISPQQTVLWDQIQYTGDPSEFAWVLPVKPGAVIQPSTAAFFEVLEAATSRQILIPTPTCPSSGRGQSFGCVVTADSAGGGGPFPPAMTPVTVVHEGTVGPYETVTLHTSTPGALNQWLGSHNYNVDASSQPVIDAYVSEGFDFIAIRLQPGAGVRQMTPVRVVMPGASTTLPLRMVSIGTGAHVPIVLYVIGEGRYHVATAPDDQIDTFLLSWDFAQQTSNYAGLRAAALADNGGVGWLTAFAEKGALTDTNAVASMSPNPNSTTVPTSVDILMAYQNQANLDGETAQADDFTVATTGMPLGDVWVTRLEANLPHSALSADIDLGAADPQANVARTLTPTIMLNTSTVCGPSGAVPVVFTLRPPAPPWLFAMGALGGAGVLLAARRRRPLQPSHG